MSNGQQTSPPSNGLGIAGFIVSLVGYLSCGLICPVGLIMSLVALKREPKGFAIAGVVFGALGSCWVLVAAVITMIVGVGFIAGIAAIFSPQVATHIEMGVIDARIQAYEQTNGSPPQSLSDLGLSGRELQDAWGHPFVYELTDQPPGWKLTSPGPDGTLGTSDDITRP